MSGYRKTGIPQAVIPSLLALFCLNVRRGSARIRLWKS
jgi:hypothetical protein